MKGFLKNLQVIVIFMVIWIILNENVRLLTLFTGLFISVSTLRFTNALLKVDYAKTFYVPPVAFFLYTCALLKDIYVSGYDMVKRIFMGNITPTFIEYDSSLSSQLSLILLSNGVTLPPGTITVSRHENHLIIVSPTSDKEQVCKDVARIEQRLNRFEKELKQVEEKIKGVTVSNKV